MIRLGPIVMPCRTCDADPGAPCTAGVPRGAIGDPGMTFHAQRTRDAAMASELISDPDPEPEDAIQKRKAALAKPDWP